MPAADNLKKRYSLGILGYPLSHSLSPAMQSQFLKLSGLGGRYDRFEVPPGDLANWMNRVKGHPEMNGFNVTIPHKRAIKQYLDNFSLTAQQLGVVNTVYQSDKGLVGDNTDITGFEASLPTDLRERLKGSSAIIMGAGGSSRPVALALMRMGVSVITFLVRNRANGQTTLDAMSVLNATYFNDKTTLQALEMLPEEAFDSAGLIINTTPVGQFPNTDASILNLASLNRFTQTPYVYDLIYNPNPTKLLSMAQSLNYPTQNGLSMLLHQGLQSFELWTGTALTEEQKEKAWTFLQQSTR